ncbi:MAG: hypothetical protein WCQ00_00535 [bacterium]
MNPNPLTNSLNNTNKKNHLIPKIGVSGAADMGFLNEDVYLSAKEVGREITRQGAILITGATTGFPYWSAVGCKESGGISVGFSPASSADEHINVYRLPVDYMDFIIYTGFGYNGRDLLFTRSCDAVIIGPGRIGTLHEFAVCYEDQKPLGILTSKEWETGDLLKIFMEKSHRPNTHVIFDDNPKRLVERLLDMLPKEKKHLHAYKNDDGVGGSKGERVL